MTKRFSMVILLLLGTVLMVSGCGDKTSTENKAGNSPEPAIENKGNAVNEKTEKEIPVSPDPENEELNISYALLFPTESYVVDGDESHKYEKVNITTNVSGEEAVLQAIEYLSSPPQGLETVVSPKRILGVEEKDGVVTVDVDPQGLQGSLDEEIFVTQITESLFSLDEVREVRFLVFGEPATTLTGHVDISKPFQK